MGATTAIDLITKERKEQLEKHGFTIERDGDYTNNELLKAAMYLLTLDIKYWPENWPVSWRIKFHDKTVREQLVTAAALIAADIDRRDFESKS